MASVFYFCNGRTARSPKELLAVLRESDDSVFAYHCNREKRDFCNWIRDGLGNEKLAKSIARVRTRKGLISKLKKAR